MSARKPDKPDKPEAADKSTDAQRAPDERPADVPNDPNAPLPTTESAQPVQPVQPAQPSQPAPRQRPPERIFLLRLTKVGILALQEFLADQEEDAYREALRQAQAEGCEYMFAFRGWRLQTTSVQIIMGYQTDPSKPVESLVLVPAVFNPTGRMPQTMILGQDDPPELPPTPQPDDVVDDPEALEDEGEDEELGLDTIPP